MIGFSVIRRHVRQLALAGLALVFGAAMPAQAQRLALVVGNANYDTVEDLKNPANDAKAIGDALAGLGFEVTVLTDAPTEEFWTTLDTFTAAAETAESTVFFYAGHAFQMGGANYLVPVSAQLTSREAIKSETWNLDAIIARLQSRNRQSLIFLDACRNDPLPAAVRGSGAAADGLARVQTGVGTFVAFATEPGGVSADAIADEPNSPFTKALLNHISTEGISVSDMMIAVRNDVEVATLRKQVPWDQSSLRSQFYFVPPSEGGKQELSEADYELLAQLEPEDRRKFLDLLAQSGFDETSLKEAEAAIAVAESNLELVAVQSTTIGGPSAPSAPVDVAQVPAEPEAPKEQTEPGGLAGLEVVQSDVSIGDAPAAPAPEVEVALADPAPAQPAPTEPAPTEPATRPVEIADVAPEEPAEDGRAPVRLAALTFDTRDIAINEVTVDRLRVEGRQIQPDSDENRAILAAIDPTLLETEAPAVAIPPEQLAAAVQGELKRVGCYQMKVDGSWGKGSRTALTSFYLAKRIVPDSLEPTQELFDLIQKEKKVVCEVRVATSAVKAGTSVVQTKKADAKASSGADGIKGRKTGSKKPLETKKKKIEKATIGMTGSF